MILIRADGNAKTGAGHLMRCLTIAQTLPSKEEVLFLCAEEASGELVEKHGFAVQVLHTDYREMEAELAAWEKLSFLKGKRHTILVDSYFVTDSYLQALQTYGRVTLLDDIGNHRYPVDRVINYNAPAEKSHYEALYTGTDTELVIGSTFVPLRQQFSGTGFQVREKAGKILITTGGGDAENIAGKILDTLRNSALPKETEYCLIMGAFHPHFQEMQELAESFPQLHLYYNVENMADLMCQCDVAVTAGGTTVYELAAVGVPMVCFSYAENQEALTEYMGRQQEGCFAGAYHKKPEETLLQIARFVLALCQSTQKRRQSSLWEQQITDGHGAERLAGILQKDKEQLS